MSFIHAQHVHFIGIGGIGISALAKMLYHKGMQVSGTNDSESPETLDELRAKSVPIQLTTSEDVQFPDDIDTFVYSVAWENRVPQVLEAARRSGKPVLSYFDALGEVSKEYQTIAIAGTHGKTTTTAMTAVALTAAGLDPTVIVGSLVDFPSAGGGQTAHRSNFRAGRSEYLVVEACEYKRHFLHFSPYILAVTNIELDHPDYYKDLADVEDAFAQAASQSEIVLAQDSIEQYLLRVPDLLVPGEHNRKNAALVLAVADALGADLEKVKDALAAYRGSWRRFEYKGTTKHGALVYDDYAHHPTEIRVTLKAAKEKHPEGRVIAVFEPHMFSRTKGLFDEFATAFKDADKVVVAPIYAAREPDDGTMSAEVLAKEIKKHNKHTRAAKTLEEAAHMGAELASKPEDVLVFMSAGDIYTVIPSIIAGK
jgi:UDP-N-acetylmuramate--alanine ligase